MIPIPSPWGHKIKKPPYVKASFKIFLLRYRMLFKVWDRRVIGKSF